VKVGGHRNARADQDRDRHERAETESPRDHTEPLAVGLTAKRRHNRRCEEQLPADEERHGQEVQVADERHPRPGASLGFIASTLVAARERNRCLGS
jgi:hypothetical protein